MRQIPYLTIRGKPIAMVYSYREIIRAEFADWIHRLKRGQTRHVLIDWATEKYYTNNLTIERMAEQPKTVLRDNEAEAIRVAIMKHLRDKAEDAEITLTQGDDL